MTLLAFNNCFFPHYFQNIRMNYELLSAVGVFPFLINLLQFKSEKKTLHCKLCKSKPLLKLVDTFTFFHCCIKKKKKKKSPRSPFAVWDHTRTIMAYWPSSVSMGTEKPFLPLLRLESYLLLFYFGIAHADYLEARCCYSKCCYLSHNIYLSYHYV